MKRARDHFAAAASRLLGRAPENEIAAREGSEGFDRRIRVFDQETDRAGAIQRMSDIRHHPFVVLLGEPGIGKSTVLTAEADAEGVLAMSVRRFINDPMPAGGSPLYLDGLDEYRMDGSAADKVQLLTMRMAEVAPRRWRLVCRAEDWRKEADLRAVRRAAGEAGIVVAQILPFDEDEAFRMLDALGEDDPLRFIAEARRRGAGALLENPLSLRLLHKAVRKDERWPGTRYELFDTAAYRLAHEHNDERKANRNRASAQQILAATDRASLVLLATGARALWRSAGMPPVDDQRAVVVAADLGMDPAALGSMLDTPFFTGTGDWFEPMHRSVAEFLSGRALARAVLGDADNAAYPLARALALVTAPDGKAPTELRGLYAWFAAHLARMGAAAQARELVQNDAVSILVYGDAAAFDLDTRRALLASLDRDDPYFLGFDTGATALGALASDDFADTLIAVLEAPDDTHRLSTVFEVLLHGRPLELVRPVLRRIALDPARPEWQRTRAIAAWLNSDGDGDAMRRDLFDALGVEARSPSREMLRAQLLAGMSDAALRDEDVRAVLTDYTASSDDSVSMRLYGLGRRLRAAPRLALLDVPLSGPVEEEVGRRASMEIDRLLDEMLAAAIQATTDLRAGRLWRWTVNVREDRWDDLGDAAGKAARAWLESDARRRRDFIDAIIDDDATEVEGGGAASHLYFHVLGQWPESDVIRHLMSRAEREAIPARRERLLVEIVEGARRFPDGAGAFDTVYEWLSAMPDEDAHFQRLKMSGLEAPRTRSAARARRIREASVQHCRENVAACTPHLEAIRSGEAVDILADFARIYFLGEKDDLEVDGRDQIEAQSDAAIADAVIVGLKELALGAVPFTPRELGIAEGRGETYAWELAALAGVDLLLARDPPTVEAASPALALVVLRQLGFVQDDSRRSRLDHWACQRLDLDMVAGAQAIVEQWEGLRGTRRSGGAALWLMPQASRSSAAMGLAIERMLTLHPDLPPDPLHMLLVGAAERLSPALIDRLADAALAHPKLPKPARAIWSVVKFALGGDAERERLRGHRAATIEELLEAPLGDGLLELLPSRDDAQRAARLAAVIRIIGPKAAPENSRPNGRLLQPYRKSDAVHAAIRRLSGNPDPVAGRLLLEFIGDAKFGAWHLQLRHARAQHLRILRDTQFVAPSARMVLNALAGKGPANAADLRAIVVEEMGRLARELRTDSKSPWRFYWNTNHQTKPVDPKNENLCRDLTLSSLQERLKPYGIPVAIPEATHGLDTRADMLMTSGAGRKMPVEAKRHYHKDLWSAASEQLQGYAAAEGADGNGMLLVYWFGADWAPTPARTDARTADSARELGELLVADLSEGLRERTDVVVFDVSRPEGGLSQAELARERRASAPAKRRRPKTTAAPAKPGRRGKAILAGTATKKAAIGVVAPRGDGVKQPTAPDTEVEMPNGEGRRLSGTPAKSPRSRASKGQTLSGEDD